MLPVIVYLPPVVLNANSLATVFGLRRAPLIEPNEVGVARFANTGLAVLQRRLPLPWKTPTVPIQPQKPPLQSLSAQILSTTKHLTICTVM